MSVHVYVKCIRMLKRKAVVVNVCVAILNWAEKKKQEGDGYKKAGKEAENVTNRRTEIDKQRETGRERETGAKG